jgi:hypothetical protein
MKNAVFWGVADCSQLTLVPRSRIFLPWRWRRYVLPKRRFTQYLHGATSKKTAFFIVTAVETSNLIKSNLFLIVPFASLIYDASSKMFWSLDSSVCIAARLRFGIGVRFPAEAGHFSLLCSVQTGFGALPASYQIRTGFSFPGGKTAGTWSWSITSI